MTSDAAALRRRLLPKVALSLCIGGLFAWVAARGGVPLVPPVDAFREVHWWAVPAYVSLMLVMHLVRATRFRFLIAPIKHIDLRDIIALNWIGFFAIFALPFRLGEVARPALTKLRHGVPISAGVGTIAVERVVDGLLTSFCVAWALWVMPLRATDDPIARHLPAYGITALIVFSSAFAALFAFLWKRDLMARLSRAVIGVVSPRLAELLSSKVESLADGLRCLADPALAAGFLGETLVYWAVNAFAMWVLAVGCGLPLTPGHGIAIMGILAIGILLPAGPGLFGSFQLAVSTGLKCYVSEAIVGREGSVYIFLLYGIQAIVVTVCGLVPLYRMDLRMRDVLDSGEGPSGENLASTDGAA